VAWWRWRFTAKRPVARAIGLDNALDAQPDYLAIDLTFEAYESWALADFWADFSERLAHHVSTALPTKLNANAAAIEALLASNLPTDGRTFQRFFRQLYQLAPQLKVVLVKVMNMFSYRIFCAKNQRAATRCLFLFSPAASPMERR
jgi:hypothetical protein